MGTSRMSPTIIASSAQAQPVQSPFQINNLPGAVTAQVNTHDGKLAAIAAIIRFSQNHGYFIYQHEDPMLSKKAITMTQSCDNGKFLIQEIDDNLPDLRMQRIYIQVHHVPPQRLMVEHLLDHLAENTLGRKNLELKKNVTIDVFDSDADWGLRDNAGFIVTDRLQLHQISVDSDELFKVLKQSKDITITNLKLSNETDKDAILDYDCTLSTHNRAEFLEFLFSQTIVYIARRENVVGYLVASKADNRVLALYADDQNVADTLLLHHLKQSKAKKAIFCTPRAQWRKLSTLFSLKSRAIYRRHTRSVPSNVKWDRIYAFNAGLNLF
uniref:YitH acetyltransferase (GNAT) domain-containing protein n=1 Tax=Panagrolaimus sp. JU765 TaxID=591449 RepID=A0AC34PWM3_9BILA